MARMAYNGHDFLLTYSSNVHPGESLEDLLRVIREDIATVKARAFTDQAMGLNLRLGMAQIDTLQDPAARAQLAETLADNGMFLFTVNGFPIRDFHAPRVKEDVYLPSWHEAPRADYTIGIAQILAELLPDDVSYGSISSLTGCFQPTGDDKARHETMARETARVVVALATLADTSGREISLGLEPEPFTTAETTPEFIAYFNDHLLPHAILALVDTGRNQSDAETLARRHLGINLDLCHQAVEFEDCTESVKALEAAGMSAPRCAWIGPGTTPRAWRPYARTTNRVTYTKRSARMRTVLYYSACTI